MKLTCKQCNKEFSLPPSKAEGRKYCGMKCYKESVNTDTIVECKQCGDDFKAKKWEIEGDNRQYCSTDCYHKNLKENPPERLKTIAKGHTPWNKGKTGLYKTSEETKKKQSEALRGDKSHLWKGGVTSLNNKIRGCFKYRNWRKEVFERDNYECVKCGKNGVLHADHIKPFAVIREQNDIESLDEALNCDEFWNTDNGRTLCKDCHKETESFQNQSIVDTWRLEGNLA